MVYKFVHFLGGQKHGNSKRGNFKQREHGGLNTGAGRKKKTEKIMEVRGTPSFHSMVPWPVVEAGDIGRSKAPEGQDFVGKGFYFVFFLATSALSHEYQLSNPSLVLQDTGKMWRSLFKALAKLEARSRLKST